MRKLDILVPMYNESENVVKTLLDSIALQQNVDLENDVGVIICCDGGSTQLSEEFLGRYPFSIEFHMCEHKGVSATRNACLDHSSAEYVMFLGEPIEEWKDIKGYEGFYKISTYGRVYSTPRFRTKGGIIRPSTSTSGYLCTHLCKDGIVRTFQIHRLVATHFMENPENLEEVNHKDECKTNNCLANLEFCSRTYNQKYGTAIARSVAKHNYKESAKKSAAHHDYEAISIKRTKTILQMDMNGNLIKRWRGLRSICKDSKFCQSKLSLACRGIIESAYGYKWKYEKEIA